MGPVIPFLRRTSLLVALWVVAVVGCGPPDSEVEASASSPVGRETSPPATPSAHLGADPQIPPRFETLTAVDGLVSNEANVFLQDRQGFLWVGTFNGLSRFDGATFRSFLHDPADSTSLGHNSVNWLHQDRHGAIWVGTNGGLDRFDPETETFAHVRHDPQDPTSLGGDVVRTLAESADGTVWVGTSGGGLNRLDPATETVRRIGRVPDESEDGAPRWDTIHALLANDDGTLWVGSSEGLALYDPATDIFTPVSLGADGPGPAPRLRIACLLRDRTGAIWVGTVLDGAFRYDPVARTARHYPYAPTVPGALGDPWVLSMIEDRTGTVWLGTNGGGLHRYDPATDAFDRYAYDPSDPQSLRDDDVLALLEDRDGVLWVGTYAGLARRYPLSAVVSRVRARPGDGGLRSNTVTSFAEEADGTLWIGTDGGGLQRRDPGGAGGLAHVPYDPDRPRQRAATDILSLALDDAGALWVGAIGGLYRRDPDTGGFARIAPSRETDIVPVTYDLHVAGGRVLGAAGASGVIDIEPASGRIRRIPATSTVMSVLRDPSGGVWAGSYATGLWRVAEAPGGERALVRPSVAASAQEVTTIYQDRRGALWVGTADGLDRLTVAGADTLVTRFHRTDGLPNTYVWGLAEDARGRLWVATSAGLSLRDPETGAFVSYGPQDGIEAGGPLYRSPHSGRFYVGGELGFAAFDPADLRPEPPPPAPVLTGLQVHGEPVRIGAPGSPLARSLSATDAVRLRYDDRVVRIAFASLDFRAPGTHRYAVRLDGFDDDWRDVGGQREATFTALRPGRYTFRVRAAGRDGVWGAETALAVTVAPPWWRAWWAYALYALAVGALAAAVVRDRRRRTQLRHRLEIEQLGAEALRDLDQAKSQFFANVSHEFRTPLTLTLGPLDDVLAGEYGPVPAEAAEPIGLARRSAGRVLALINQILDVSRLEAGHTPLRARALDLGAFVEAQVEAFVPLAMHRRIAVEVAAPDALEVWADPGHLGTILTNLLANAFKFTPAGGAVSVEVGADERARVVVRDTGPGIAEADLPHIFDRFYRAEGGAGRPLGSGIGLALAHELAALHGGALTAESTPGQGSAFVLAVPLGTDHLAPEQIDDRPWHGAVPAPVPIPDEPAAPSPPGPDGDDVTTVLVADDEPDIRAYVRRHLEGAGYRVVEAADGEAALALIRERLPDLVVSDVMMPRLDGLGLCRALRSDPETDFLPVLLLTAKAAPEDRLGGLAELCDAYLTKPFDVGELVARVDTLIAIRRRLRDRFAGRAGTEASGDGSAEAPPAVWSADDAFEARVRSVIEARLGDDDFSVAALAEAVGLSRSHLLRRTTALMGATPSDLIRTARLDRAARLLAAQAGTVSEVAYGVGFKSVAHFSNAFLAHTGARPSAFVEANG